MLIRYMSDVHLEFGWMNIMSLEEDKDTVLVLAGDIGVVSQPDRLDQLGRFLVDASVRFRAIIYIAGNHEFYHSDLFKTRDLIRQKIERLGLTNVFFLENETKIIDDVAFIAATLWTNYDNDPVKAVLATQAMNDFRLIWNGYSAVRPSDFIKFYDESKAYVFDQVKAQKEAGLKTVVVVHHGVSYQSVHAKYKGDPYNSAFVSELSNEILDTQPNIIIHGHVHDAFDYMIGDTRVLVNPRGYVGHETGFNGFDPVARIEV